MDRPVEELTREELVEALTNMGALLQQERDFARQQYDFLFDCMDRLARKETPA